MPSKVLSANFYKKILDFFLHILLINISFHVAQYGPHSSGEGNFFPTIRLYLTLVHLFSSVSSVCYKEKHTRTHKERKGLIEIKGERKKEKL